MVRLESSGRTIFVDFPRFLAQSYTTCLRIGAYPDRPWGIDLRKLGRAKGWTPVNKAELVAQVAKESDLSKDAAEKAVDATFKNIEKALKVGDTVRIVGFGNFQVAQRKASTGRNPRTGAEVHIPASRVPKFRAGKALKEACNS